MNFIRCLRSCLRNSPYFLPKRRITLASRKRIGLVSDLAGTVFDPGCKIPKKAIASAFSMRRVPLTKESINQDMGKGKWDHVSALFVMPSVKKAWQKQHQQEPTEKDVKEVYDDFVKFQMNFLSDEFVPIPCAWETLTYIQSYFGPVGYTTGYTRAMTDTFLSKFGFRWNGGYCSDEVSHSRPDPSGCLQLMKQFELPRERMVKVGDTPADMEEGKRAGFHTIGVIKYSSRADMDLTQITHNKNKYRATYEKNLKEACEELWSAGADHVVKSIADVPFILHQIREEVV